MSREATRSSGGRQDTPARRSAGSAAGVLVLLVLAGAPAEARAASDLVVETLPADSDRTSRGVTIAARFAGRLELDADADGTFTAVRAAAVESGEADIAVAVNDPGAAVRVRFSVDDDGDPLTPGSTDVAAEALWSLNDHPPLLRVRPAAPLQPGRLYRTVFFEGAPGAPPRVRRASDGEPALERRLVFYTLAAGRRGTSTRRTFTPPSLGYPEDFKLYLPPGHGDSPSQTYPALYLLHGGGGSWSSWDAGSYTSADAGRAAEIADTLIDQGTIEPLIIVMPDGNGGPNKCIVFPWHHLFSNDRSGAYRYGDFTSQDLPDHVEANWRARADRDQRGVSGMSMGGFGAASVGLGHVSRFGLVGPIYGWQHSIRLVTGPDWPACVASHWTTIPSFGPCYGEMLQAACGPAGSTDLTHCKSVNGRDLAENIEDADYRGSLVLAHGVADTTARVEWSDDISCALDAREVAHCYERPAAEAHTWTYANSVLERQVLPRLDALTRREDLPAGQNAACVNAVVVSPADADFDSIPDDGDRSGFAGDAPCSGGAVAGCDDNCRDDPNAAQEDLDADGIGDLCDADRDGDGLDDAADCDPLDPGAGQPGLVTGVRVARAGPGGTARITWTAAPRGDLHDLARGLLSGLAGGSFGSCLAEDLTALSYDDPDLPPAGDGYSYLLRGEDTGCGGAGEWGSGSSGAGRGPIGCSP